MDIELAADELNDQFEKGVRSLSRSVKLPGFRKGKIPKDVIRQRFRSDVLEQAIQDLVPKAVNEALKERELYPIDDPRVSNLESKLGEPLRFRATFEVIPSIEVRNYKDIEASEQKTIVTDEQIEAGIEHLREQNARFDPIEGRGAEDHDIVLGDLVETPSGGGAEKRHEDVSIEVGTEAYHKSLHEMLQGAEPGADISFTANFDADGGDPERAGKSFDVTFHVKELKEKVLPDADDELAKDMGSFDTLDEVKAEFRSQAEKRAEREDEQHLRTQLIQKLIDANAFDSPESLTEREIDSRLEAAARDLYQKGVDPTKAGIDWNAVRTEQRASAEAAVRATLLLDRIAQQESIEVTEAEVSAELQKASEVLEKSPEALRAQMMKDGSLEQLTGRLRREKAVDFIKQHAKLK
jgi:trigger factor